MKYYKLSNEQTEFLNEYHPQGIGFPLLEDIEKIKSILGIGTDVKESELQQLRNSVIRFYVTKIDIENDVKQVMNYVDSMESVVIAIDTMIYHY